MANTTIKLQAVVDSLKKDPYSRRHIISAWNVAQLERMALAPCHCLVQFYVSKSKYLHCQFYQRSIDVFLGLPFNIASYSLLSYMLAQLVGLKPGKITLCGGDTHLYKTHLEMAKEQLKRSPFPFPKLSLDKSIQNIDDFCYESIALEKYKAHNHIAAPIAV